MAKILKLASVTVKTESDRDMVRDWLKKLLDSPSLMDPAVTKFEYNVELEEE